MATSRAASFPARAGIARPRLVLVWRVPRLRLGWLLACLLAGLTAAGIEVAQIRSISRQIAPLIETDLWALPSKIYSRPQFLHAGLRLEKDQLVARLRRLGYTEPAGPLLKAGQFRSVASGLEIFTRDVNLPGGAIEGRPVRVSFRTGGRVTSVSEPSGKAVARVALEPELLATLTGQNTEDRTVLPLSEFPESLVRAVITAEDRRFFQHPGIDPIRILQATWTNLRRGEIVQGASTITQQTAKNLFLGSERTFSRKLREAQIALALEASYSKEKILEVYLNEVYLGQRDGVSICGFGEASRLYFGKDVRDLDLAESALLAAMIPSPSTMNPLKHSDRAIARRNVILKAMLEQQQITDAAYRTAVAQTPLLTQGSAAFRKAPSFVQFVRKQLRGQHSEQTIVGQGMRIYTTLDTNLQTIAEASVKRGLEKLEQERPRLKRRDGQRLEAAMVVLDPSTGEILALVGGRDFSKSQFDHALLAHRQPGSLFKPFIYLAGFERAEQDPDFRFTPSTLLDDSPIEIANGSKVWSPQNYDEEFRGPVTVRQALEESINIPAVRASQEVGLQAVASVARKCGISLPAAVYPSLALGSEQVTPLEMARAYSAIASGGQWVEPFGVLEVVDQDGQDLYRSAAESRPAVSPTSAYLTLDMMRGVLDRGTAASARAAGIVGDFAGKTGTTNDKRDAWFIGFSPDLLVAVWVGFDDNAETGLTGANGALPLWIDFIRSSGASPSTATFPEPPGITRVRIDRWTGALATDRCPETLEEPFLTGTEPIEPCPEHGGLWEWRDRFRTD